MLRCIKEYLLLLSAGLYAGLLAAAPAMPENMTLLGRSTAAASIRLDDAQQAWLQARRELVLGTSAPDYPPFDLTTSGQDYEGMTADYAAIIAQATGLPMRVLRFNSRDAALAALEHGQIDLLGTANGFEARHPDIALSTPYAVDQPVLVTRTQESPSLADGLEGLRLSMVYHYLPLEEIERLYPKAHLTTYPSYQNAINAVAFGQADVFLGDTLSTHYMISKGYLSNIRMASFGQHEAFGFGFAVRRSDNRLLEIVNATLNQIPLAEQASISKRWSAGSDVYLADHKIQLTDREQRWLAAHPVVRVVVNENSAPFTFFDSDGTLRGISADLLELIRLRTGLRLDIQRRQSDSEMIAAIQQGQADLIAAFLPSRERQQKLKFSRPYLDSSFVLLTRKQSGTPATLDQFDSRSLAIAKGNPLIEWLRSQYPDIRIVETDGTLGAMEMLAQGQVDGSVSSLVMANYFISSHSWRNTLQINSTVGTQQALFALASGKNATALNSILDKALISIDPDQLGVINNRWRGYVSPSQHTWRTYHRLFFQIVAGVGLLLLLSLAWNAYMQRQIRQRQRAELALNDQLEFMHSLLNGTPHPIYVRDRNGVLQSCNDSYLETFDARREDVIGKNVLPGSMSNAFEAQEYQADYQRVMAEGTPLIVDRPLHIGDRALTIYHWILPYRNSAAEVQGIIGGWIDISERRQLFEELRASKKQADDANRAKSTFLATMSHEIRTPMNAVIGMLELALKQADKGHVDRSTIEVAYESAAGLLELIGDILDIARIESGHLSLAPERVNLRTLLQSVIRVFEGVARQKNLALSLQFDAAEGNPDVLMDPLRFKQVVSNLISNALKFTEQGRVLVKVQLSATDQDDIRHLHLEVIDSGIGIGPADLKRLFEPFAQVDNTGRMARKGAGLGLVISRNLCQMMGGTLLMNSQPGLGTQVQVRLQLAVLPTAPICAATLPAIETAKAALNVLVVDDHPANRLLMSQQLEYLGYQYQVARDGAHGLEVWQQGHFDLVIADCNMPIMSGYELARSIRRDESEQKRPSCVILGFTANAQPEEKQRCLDAGMNDCLFKPISLSALSQWIKSVKPSRQPSVFNLQSLHALTGGDPSSIQRLLAELLNSNRLDRQELLDVAQDGDRQVLTETAHKIKGVARIVQATALIQRCEALEQACHPASTAEQINECIEALDQTMTELGLALETALAKAE
ncbi:MULTISPECIES: transporter substrate-binding domain-containing protein [Pseudomonas]|uniref:transporter substrate-binding domain-containing protein n=1 Tax=Pseudomonas TaxID=286 RepID=UPI001BEACE1C|nr:MULTISPECIES: transporter substrate-binding domain-containing protein [Pseudomonas]MBT2341465.1 transporter substrate-binding domain-containing protein [Pseudomonas fluorescens]MCD4531559.1 transporter substrate-binding domain-containing protein [Pseudomonas sp. C3-2018]